MHLFLYMKKIVSLSISFLYALLSFGLGNIYAQDVQKQVAVFVYNDKTVTTPTTALRAKLTSSLVNERSRSYIVIDRTDDILNALKKEYNYQSGGLVRDDQLVSIGEHLGANYLCVVNITFYQSDNQYFFECKLVNVETRQIERQSFYPNDDSIVSSLAPQQQIKVAGELSSAFFIKGETSYVVGDVYYDNNREPVYIEGVPMRIGYIDETGEHGFSFVVLPFKCEFPKIAKTTYELQLPYLSQLRFLMNNKELLNLNGEYWARDGGSGGLFLGYYEEFSIDFASGRQIKHRCWGKQMKDNKVSVIGTTGIPRSESTEALSIECINILLF